MGEAAAVVQRSEDSHLKRQRLRHCLIVKVALPGELKNHNVRAETSCQAYSFCSLACVLYPFPFAYSRDFQAIIDDAACHGESEDVATRA
jgi:hypothetical protein